MSPSLKSSIIPLEEVPLSDEAMSPEEAVKQPEVLVVDDEPMVADTLSAILRQAGFTTRTAYHADEALTMASESAPDLMISDVAMPDMNGIELAMALVTDSPRCKVLLFSGHATRADLAGARESGFDFPLLAKPVHPADLLRQVAEMLNVPVKVRPVRFSNVLSLREMQASV